tara:strand:+ start:18918 stop:20021 length:1104 start_codon:yes stop_codon:yes gene_type:complete
MRNKKIAIFVAKAEGGGAEKSATNVANFIASKGYELDFITLKQNTNKKLLHKNINHINLNVSRLLFSIPKLFKYLIRNNHKKFYFVSFLNGPNVIGIFLKLIFHKFNLVCTLHNPLTSHLKYTTFRDKVIILILLIFKNIPQKYITCSYYIKKELIEKYNFKKNNLRNVYGPIDFVEMSKKRRIKNNFFKKNKKNNKVLISIGRLSYQKNYSDLILKLKNLLLKKNIILIILGVGNEYSKLKSLIKKNKLSKKVFLLGYKSDPVEYMRNSDLFILNSRWEGLGLVLIESIFLKIPIICNKCPGGVNEIFDNTNNKTIFDFNNQKRLEDTIKELLYKKNKKNFMLKKKYLNKFKLHQAANEYLKFIIS